LKTAREEADREVRHSSFINAMDRAQRAGDMTTYIQSLALAVIMDIGTGNVCQLIGLMSPYFGTSKVLRDAAKRLDSGHFMYWAAERVLYFAPEVSALPKSDLNRMFHVWAESVRETGCYKKRALLRMGLHHSLRLGELTEADSLMRRLKKEEPEDTFVPRGSSVAESEEEKPDATEFGCRAYFNQMRVLYYCARGEADSAWRDARFFLEGRSACDLSLCAVAPREAIATLLDTLDEAGMHVQADEAHRVGLPMVKSSVVSLGWLGHHVRYLVRRGRKEEASLLLEGTPEVEVAIKREKMTPLHHFHFLRGLLSFGRLWGLPERFGTMESVERELACIARDFDNRNGSDSFRRSLEKDRVSASNLE
jgi:hypothetical protein